MKNKLKYLFIIPIVALISFFVFNFANAQIEISDIDVDKVVDNSIYTDEKGQNLILYTYKTNAVAAQTDEILNLRTNSSQTFSLGQDRYRTKFYSSNQFIKENDTWFQLETATTTLENWNKATEPNLLTKIFGFSVNADTFYSGAGDGLTQRYNASGENWTTIRAGAGTSANYVDDEQKVAVSANGSNSFTTLNRLFFPFDTSDLPDGATIDSAVLHLVGSGKANGAGLSDENAGIVIVSGTPASNSQLQASDFSQIGTTAFGSKTYTDITSDGASYFEIELNSDGKNYIDDTGYTVLVAKSYADQSDTNPQTTTGETRTYFFMSEKTGTASDPFLEIEYTEGGEPPVGGVATSTGTSTNYMEFSLILILFFAFFLLIGVFGTKINKWFKNLLYDRI